MRKRYTCENHPLWNSKEKDWAGTQPLIDAIKDHPVTEY